MGSLELKISFFGSKATDLPHINTEQFQAENIELRDGICTLTASAESLQTESITFLVNGAINVAYGMIGAFLYEKLQRLVNIKTKIGTQEVKPPYTLENIREILREELERINKAEEE